MTDEFRIDDLKYWWQVYIGRIILAFDQLFNVFLLGFPDESISGRVGRAILTGKPRRFAVYLEPRIDRIFEVLVGEKNHCKNSVEPEERFKERKELWKWYHD